MILVIGVLASVGGVLLAQGNRLPVDPSPQDALLAEFRALRAEVRQVAAAGIRTQLLVARLQLQEQRVFTLARQLTDAQNALATARLEIAGEQARVRQLEDAKSRGPSGPGWLALQQAIRDAGSQIEHQQRQEQQLQAQETELRKAANDAQGRWSAFSGQLDALERSLEPESIPQN